MVAHEKQNLFNFLNIFLLSILIFLFHYLLYNCFNFVLLYIIILLLLQEESGKNEIIFCYRKKIHGL